MKKPNRSALEHLRILPEVFTLQTAAAALNMEPRVASIYLKRWREQGLVSSLGERTGMHFNLLRNPDAAHDGHLEAVAFLYPRGVIGGASAIHAAGWTTQIPRSLELIIPTARTILEIPNVMITTRSEPWFRRMHSRFLPAGPIPRLDPALALADAWAKKLWRPDPDEIEWDIVDAPALRAAFREIGWEVPEEWEDEMEDESPRP